MSDYRVRLAEFEGPLDLLLHLVHTEKIDLKDIFVSQITEQYLRYMENVHEVDLDRASEFLRTASLLLFIKSRSLLPRPRPMDAEEEEDPEKILMEQLVLYRKYKLAAQFLETRQDCSADVFAKLPDEFPEPEMSVVIGGDGRALEAAFLSALKRGVAGRQPRRRSAMSVEADRWTIRGQKEYIRDRLSSEKEMTFAELLAEDAELVEIAATFGALLELWSSGSVQVWQALPFGTIRIHAG